MTRSSATTAAVSTAAKGAPRPSYWVAVWRTLRRNRVARFGVWCIGAMFVAAIAAPLVSLNQPIVWVDDSGVSFPIASALFNRLIFESSVDIYFNLWLVALGPVLLGVGVVRRRMGAQFVRVRARVFWGVIAAHLLAFAVIAPKTHFGVVENPAYHSAPIVNYRAMLEAQQLEAEEPQRLDAERGNSPRFSLFPLRRFSYQETNPRASIMPPSPEHWLGTDKEGRDVFARMLYGTRISLTIGVVAVSIYVAIGVFLGALAGYFGGWIDNVISRMIEVMICFPSFFLILTLAALIEERSIFHVMVIIGVTRWTDVARLIRAEFLKHRELEYAQAALALGARHARVIFRHILPNAIAPVLVSATFGVAAAILIESSLSFLGIGDTTVPSWGETLNTGRVEQKLWLVLAPGLAIFFVVSIFNLVGEGLRDALDPKLRS